MLDDGERLVPGFRRARALRVWAGVRPLFQDARAGEVKDTRDVSRTHAVVDHLAARRHQGPADDVGRQADDAAAHGPGPRRRDVRAARRGPPVPHDGGPPARQRGRRGLRDRLAPAPPRGDAPGRAADLRVRADRPLAARGGDAPPRHDEPRRPPARDAARHGPVPGRLLHLPRHGDPPRASTGSTARRPRRRCARSCRSAGRACTRSSTATSCARRGSTTGSSRGCSTSSTCRARLRRQRVARGETVPADGGAPDPAQVPEGGVQAQETAEELQHVSHHDAIVDRLRARGAHAPACGSPRRARACSSSPRASARRISRRGPSTCSATTTASAVEQPLEALGALGPEHPYARVGADGIARRGGLVHRAHRGRLARALRVHGLGRAQRAAADRGRRRAALRARAGDDGRRRPRLGRPGRRGRLPRPQGLPPRAARRHALTRGRARARRRARADARGARRRQRARLRAGVRRPGLPRAQVVGQLAGRKLGGDERIAFPAVLGIKDPHGVWTGLERALGRRVFEVPDAAAVRARHARLRACCARRCAARAAHAAAQQRRGRRGARRATGVQALRVRVGLREERHAADWVVLASGGFASGGWSSTRTGRRARSRSGSTWPACRRRASRASRPATSTSSR